MSHERLMAHFDRIIDSDGAVARLRALTLDLAVCGKLVPQHASDQSAGELLQQLRAAHASGVSSSEGRKRRRRTAAEPSQLPFEIPARWAVGIINDVAAGRGQMTPTTAFTYIDVSAIDNVTGRISGAKVLAADEAPSRARKLTAEGDVLFSCVRPYLRNVAIVDRHFSEQPIASTAFAVLNGLGFVEPEYLWIALRSPLMVSLIEAKMRGQAYPAINDADFMSMPLPLPPQAEQRRIVAKVQELLPLCDRVDEARAEREQKRTKFAVATLGRLVSASLQGELSDEARFAVDNLSAITQRPDLIEKVRQTILDLAIRGRLASQNSDDEPAVEILRAIDDRRHSLYGERQIPKPTPLPPKSDMEPPFEVPAGWAWARLGELCYQVSDGPHFSPQYVSAAEGVPFLSTRNVRRGAFDLSSIKYVSRSDHEEFSKRIRPEIDDIIYTKGGTTGIAKVNDLDFEFSVWVHLAVLRIEKKKVYPRYVEMVLNSPHCYEQSQRYTRGISNFDLGLTRMVKITMPIPPLAEQRRIVAKVDDLISTCDRLETALGVTRTRVERLLEATIRQAGTAAATTPPLTVAAKVKASKLAIHA